MSSGVYKIENVNTNKVYIGSSNNIERRWGEHLYMLNKNQHHSAKLQRSWNKTFNKDIYKFSIIDEVENISDLKTREQFFIDQYDAFNNGYNCMQKTDNPKYCESYKKQLEKRIKKDDAYTRMNSLLKNHYGQFVLGVTLRKKLSEKYYGHLIINKFCGYIDWFLKNYSSAPYKTHLKYIGNTFYVTVLYADIPFAVYKVDKNVNVTPSAYDIKELKADLIKNKSYDPIKHYIISDTTTKL